MKSVISIVVVGLVLITSNAWASDAPQTALDEELENGLTVAQTLAAWDNSSVRYRMAPPQLPQTQKSNERKDDSKVSDSEKS